MNKDSEEPIKHYERPSTPRGSVQKTSSAGNTKAEYDLFLHLQLLREKVKDAVYWS